MDIYGHVSILDEYKLMIIRPNDITKVHLKDRDERNKPELATMRPDYVSAYIDHVTHMD